MTRAGPGFIFVTLVLDILGIGIVIPVLPEVVTSLVGGDEAVAARAYGPLVALYAAMQTIFAPVLGALSDRFGRRPVLLLSLLGMMASYLVLGFAGTLPWLFAGRALAGITGATITTANAYMADISTPETRARNFGLLGAAFGLGFVLGPALGGLLGELGPRVPFFAAAAVVGLNLAWGLAVLPESLAEERRRPLTLADANPLASIRHLTVAPLVTWLAGVFALQSLAQRGLESVWVLHASYRYGWGELENGLTLALVGVGAAVVQGGVVRRVVPWLGEPRALLVGLGLGVVAFTLYGSADRAWLLLAAIPLGSLGSIAGPALQSMVTGAVPAERQGSVQGALASLQSMTSMVAPLGATALFAAGTEGAIGAELPGLPLLAGAGLLLLAAGVVVASPHLDLRDSHR